MHVILLLATITLLIILDDNNADSIKLSDRLLDSSGLCLQYNAGPSYLRVKTRKILMRKIFII
jgi:hypothetical protein